MLIQYCRCVVLQLSGTSSLALELSRNDPIGQDRDGIIPPVSRKAANIYPMKPNKPEVVMVRLENKIRP